MPIIKTTEVCSPKIEKITTENPTSEQILKKQTQCYFQMAHVAVIAGAFTVISEKEDAILTSSTVIKPIYDNEGVVIKGYTAATASGKKVEFSKIQYLPEPIKANNNAGQNSKESSKENKKKIEEETAAEIEKGRRNFYLRANQNIAVVAHATCKKYVELTQDIFAIFNKPQTIILNNQNDRVVESQKNSADEVVEKQGNNENNRKVHKEEHKKAAERKDLVGYIKTQIRKAGIFGTTKALPTGASKTNLMTTTIFLEKETGWKAVLGNVGDGMILVVDKNGMLKPNSGLYPKKLSDGNYLTAQDLGMVTHRNLFQVEVVENLQAGDKIIHLTSEISQLFSQLESNAEIFNQMILTANEPESEKISQAQNMAQKIAKYCIDNKKSTEATISVIEVPDEKVELVRAFLETNDPNHIRFICDNILEENFLAQQDHNDYVNVSSQLRMEYSHSDSNGVITEKNVEKLEASYSDQETNIENFMSRYTQIKAAINSVTSRQEKWQKFGEEMEKCGDLTRTQFAKLYATFSRHPDLRGHSSPIVDFILRIEKTNSEQNVLERIRPIYKNKIIDGLNQGTISEVEKKEIGKNALLDPLICEHKHPFWRGGFGATRAKREIIREIKKTVLVNEASAEPSFLEKK